MIPAFLYRTLAKCAICESLRSLQRHAKNSALIVRAIQYRRRKTDICLHFTQDACNEDLMGTSFLGCGNCPPAAATESYIRDTKDSLETSLAAEETYYWVLGYGGDIIKLSTRDWYLEPYSSSACNRRTWAHTHLVTTPSNPF